MDAIVPGILEFYNYKQLIIFTDIPSLPEISVLGEEGYINVVRKLGVDYVEVIEFEKSVTVIEAKRVLGLRVVGPLTDESGKEIEVSRFFPGDIPVERPR